MTVRSKTQIAGAAPARTKASQAWQQAEERYRSIYENTVEGIIQSTPGGRFLSLNPAMARIYGYDSPQEMIEKVTDIARQLYADPKARLEFTRRIKRDGKVEKFEACNLRKDGSIIWTSTNASCVRDARGRVMYYEGFVQDITERKRAEEALLEGEERFRTSVENMLDSLGIYSAIRDQSGQIVDFQIEYVNAAACTSNHMTKEAQIGKRLCEILPAHRETGLFDEYCRVVETGEPISKESLIYEDVYGEERLCRVFDIRAAKLGDGFAASWRDITERRRMEEELQKSEQTLRLIAENATDVIIAYDMHRRLIYVNPALEEFTGYTVAELEEKNFINWLYPEDEAKMMALWEDLFAGKGFSAEEFRIVTKDGQIKWCLSSWGPLYDKSGQQIGVQGRERDITKRKRAEQAIQQHDRDLASLVEVSQTIITSLDMETVLHMVVDSAVGMAGLDSGAIYLLKGGELFLGATTPPLPPDFPDTFRQAPLGDHPHISEAVSTGHPVILPDTTTAELSPAERTISEARGLRSILYIPLMLKNMAVGTLILGTVGKTRQFPAAEIEMYQILSVYAAQAISNSLLFESVQQELTERKQAEEALRESEERYHNIFKNATVGIYQSTPEGRYIRVNPAMAHIYGFDSTDEMLASITDIASQIHVNPARRQEFMQLLAEQGQISEFTNQNYRKDGSIIWTSTNARVVNAQEGKGLYYEGFMTDITERKQAETTLIESENRYRSLFENMLEGFAYCRMIFEAGRPQDFIYLAVNNAFGKLTGLDNVVGKKVTEVIPGIKESNPELFEIYGRVSQTAIPEKFETYLKALDIWLSISVFSFNQGEFVSVFDNITERMQAEAALRKSEAELRALFSAMQDVVIIYDRQGRYLSIAPTSGSLYEPASEMVGKTLHEVLPEPQADLLLEHIQRALEARSTVMVDYDLDLDGRQVWFAGAISPITEDTVVLVAHDITNRKLAEKQIKESEEKFRSLFENIPDGVYRSTPDGSLLLANPALVRMLGYETADELFNVLSPDLYVDPQDRQEYVHQISRDGLVRNFEKLLKRKDGQQITCLDNAHAHYDEKGEIIFFEGALTDITPLKQAEKALRESEQQYRNLFENVPVGISVSDPSGQVIAFNDALLKPGGYAREDIHYAKDLYYDPAQRAEIVALARKKGGMYQYPVQFKRKDGTPYDILLTLTPTTFNGQPCLQALVEDVTERKRAEEVLRASEERFRSILDNIEDGYYEVDTAGNLTFFNPGQVRILGRPVNELMGMNYRLYMTPEGGKAVFQTFNRVFRTGIPEQAFNWELVRPDGTHRSVEVSVSLIKATDGIIKGFRGIVRDITERKQAEEALRQRLAELESLHTVSAALRTAQTRDEALPILLDETLAALETEAGVIWLYHPEHNELRAVVARGWFRELSETPMKSGEGIGGTVFASGQAHVSVEFRNDPLADAASREQIPDGWGGVCVPIRAGGVTIGVLYVSLPLPRQITSQQVKLLESLSNMAGATLHRMSLYEATVRQLQRLDTLRKIDLAISSVLDLRLTLNILINQIISHMDVDAADVLLLNPHTLTLEYAAGRGFRTPGIERTQLRLGEGYAGQAALERRLVSVSNLDSAGKTFLHSSFLPGEDMVAYFGLPLIAKGQVKGVLEIFHRSPIDPDKEWLDFLDTLSGQAAIAIDNGQLFNGLERSNMELALAYDTTLEGWSRALDLRDKETEGHTQRVTDITVQLARIMGIAETELVHIRRGTLLHDIGKMGVPDGILFKPGALSEADWVIMRKHPLLAFEMLSPILYLRPALDIPYCHHEKWDGSGYPRQLKEEQIPLSARIFAVVDVWDALISDRPYRSAWSKTKALDYIREQSGKHFDPRVVNAFLDMPE